MQLLAALVWDYNLRTNHHLETQRKELKLYKKSWIIYKNDLDNISQRETEKFNVFW